MRPVAEFVNFMGYGMVVPLMPLFVQQQSGGATLVGALGATYAVMELFASPVIGALSDRFGRRPVLIACVAGTMLAYIMLGLAQSLAVIFLAVALDGITGGTLATAYAYVADVTTQFVRFGDPGYFYRNLTAHMNENSIGLPR